MVYGELLGRETGEARGWMDSRVVRGRGPVRSHKWQFH